MKTKLILIRHGQSIWNKLNVFTGWVDVPLSKEGALEAKKAGEEIKDIQIDVIFTSNLIRAQMTLFLAMMENSGKKIPIFLHDDEKEKKWSAIYDVDSKDNTIPVYHSWHLNERMYGELQGVNKDKLREKYGKEQVHIWRRSFNVAPPMGESLEMTSNRTLPYFKNKILPFLEKGKNVLISAHGNSLRSIVMYLDNLSEEEVVNLEIPTGKPLFYIYENGKWTKS